MGHAVASYQVKELTVTIRASVARFVLENRNFEKVLVYTVNRRKIILELILTQKSKREGGYFFLTVVVTYVSLVYGKLQHEEPS